MWVQGNNCRFSFDKKYPFWQCKYIYKLHDNVHLHFTGNTSIIYGNDNAYINYIYSESHCVKSLRNFIQCTYEMMQNILIPRIFCPISISKVNIQHNSWVAIVTPIDRPKSVRNRSVMKLCGDVCVVICPFDISVGVGAFVLGLSQISSFFS